MKKILTLIILASLWSNVGSAEDYKWEISTMNEGQTVLASMNGNVTHGDTLMFTLRNNQGKCDILQENFTFYTMSKNPDIKKIEGKIIPIKSSEGNTHAEASYVLPFMMGHRVFFSTGSYKVDQHIDFLSKYKTYDVTIVNETKSKSAEQSNVIKNFKAADYFDVPNNSWNVKNAKEAILKAQKLCLEYKVTKKNITESKQGTKTYADGTKYVGEIKNGEPHGLGTYTSSDGRKYTGEWKNGTTDGQGTASNTDGSTFIGEFKDGEMQGQGAYTFPNGNKYVGEYKDNKRNGQGTFTYSSGDKYVGEWRDDKKNGQGTYTYADGEKYVGEWKDGKRNGRGIMSFPDGEKYVGQWKDGERNGRGSLAFTDGKIEKGIWKNGKLVK